MVNKSIAKVSDKNSFQQVLFAKAQELVFLPRDSIFQSTCTIVVTIALGQLGIGVCSPDSHMTAHLQLTAGICRIKSHIDWSQ